MRQTLFFGITGRLEAPSRRNRYVRPNLTCLLLSTLRLQLADRW